METLTTIVELREPDIRAWTEAHHGLQEFTTPLCY